MPANTGLAAKVPVDTLPKDTVTFPLAAGVFPFTVLTAPATSATGIEANVDNALVPLPIT